MLITNFTFHYGYILIDRDIEFFVDPMDLYIPLWLYSNTNRRKYEVSNKGLYIPLWLYSNKKP